MVADDIEQREGKKLDGAQKGINFVPEMLKRTAVAIIRISQTHNK